MRVIIVSEGAIVLRRLRGFVQKLLPPDAEIEGFRSPRDALEYASEHMVDTAFLDMEVSGMHGLILAKRLQALNPRINLIFMAETCGYLTNAWDMHASDYLQKPVKAENIERALLNLRFPAEGPYPATYT